MENLLSGLTCTPQAPAAVIAYCVKVEPPTFEKSCMATSLSAKDLNVDVNP